MIKPFKWCLLTIVVFFLLGIVSCSPQDEPCLSKIVLRTRRGLFGVKRTYVVCADGAGTVNYQLPQGLGDHPEWSPDREWIVFDNFESAQTNESQLSIYHIPTKETIIVNEKVYEAIYPSWSPDGTKIIYDGVGGVYLLDLECIHTGEECNFMPQFVVEGSTPSLSYDGRNLAFMARGSEIATFRLQVVDLENSNNILDITPSNVTSCLNPDWSPIENKLVARCATSSSDIFIFDQNSGEYTNLTERSLAREDYPQWSPDGSKIAFITHRDEDLEDCMNIECNISADELYVMDSDGMNSIRVTFHSAEIILWFAWIPE